jgi:FkbM family methyltransferase
MFPYIARDRYVRDERIRFDFIIADWVAAQWYDFEPHQDLPEFAWCVDHLNRSDTVVDCGAHHGLLTMIFAQAVGAKGRVYAYEASPENAAIIHQNAELNKLRNIIVRFVGLSDHNGVASFYYDSGNMRPAPDGGDQFPVVRLDDDLPPSVKVDFIKIDVEGSDVAVVKGAQRVLSQRPIIDLELHNFLFSDRTASLEAVFAVLGPLRYDYAVLPEIRGTLTEKSSNIDLAWLAQFDNPHVFCTPQGLVSRILGRFKDWQAVH